MERVCNGVVRVATTFVNAYLVGDEAGWVLVDSGVPGFASRIRRAAAETFGPDSKPLAIVLTHGHMDHSGSARALAKGWGVPIFAHKKELPYLTGRSKYPEPDPTTGGAIGLLSRMMPSSGMNLSGFVRPFEDGEEGGAVPGLSEWRWLNTPGHSPGHISLFRESDFTLIAGDALATMNMESPSCMFFKSRELSRAGAPFNHDWRATAESVQKLAALNPRVVAAGHGLPMSGPDLPAELRHFADNFPMPMRGRYVATSAELGDQGVVWLPPKPYDPFPKQAMMVSAAALGLWVLTRGGNRRKKRRALAN